MSDVSEGAVLDWLFVDLPPSANKLLRMHWTDRRILNGLWTMLVRAQIDEPPVEPVFNREHPVTILAIRSACQMLDWDNFATSLKPVLDGMQKNNLLQDDTPYTIIKLELQQVRIRHKHQQALRILFYTAEPREGKGGIQ